MMGPLCLDRVVALWFSMWFDGVVNCKCRQHVQACSHVLVNVILKIIMHKYLIVY
jgi:hypothetical protein